MFLLLGIILTFVLFRVSYAIKNEYGHISVWFLGLCSSMTGFDIQFKPEGAMEYILIFASLMVSILTNIIVRFYLKRKG